MRADEYRRQASEQSQAAEIHLASLDPERKTDKIMLGMLGAYKAALFTVAADILEAVSDAQLSDPSDLRASRNHRLRMAAIRGDQAQIDAIMKEVEDELESKSRAASGTSGQEADRPG